MVVFCPQHFCPNTKPILSYHNRYPLTLVLSVSIAIQGETFERRICPACQDFIGDGVLRKVGSGATIRECGFLLEWKQLRGF